jgi:pyridoxine 4-dehydrogenase
VPTEEEAFSALKATLTESSCTVWNAGEFYGSPDHNSLTLLKKYFERYPEDVDKVFLNIKGCNFPGFRQDSSPEGVRLSIENCLRMLGTRKKIDQFEAARKDPNTEIEVTMAAMVEHVKAGHIGGPALSEVKADTIRRAAKVARVGAVEIELSLWNTEPLTNGIAAACAELDIPMLAYCE